MELSVLLAQENLKKAQAYRDDTLPSIGRWETWAAKMREIIPTFVRYIDVLHHAQGVLPFGHLEKGTLDALKTAYFLLLYEFPHLFDIQSNLNERRLSLHAGTLDINLGVKVRQSVSNMFLWHLRSVFAAQTYCDETSRVLEIGGGFGSVCRLWLQSNVKPCKRYIIVDIPESLFFAEVCLREEFGADIGYLHDEDPGTRILLVPLGKIDEVKDQIDLVVNIGSFQEMSSEWVAFYMDWLDKCSANWLYSLNYMASPVCSMGESRNFWAPRPSQQWSAVHIDVDPTMVRMFCTSRYFVETVYERRPPFIQDGEWWRWDNRKISRSTYMEGLELLRQDWSEEHALIFLDTVLGKWQHRDSLPKELVEILGMVSASEAEKRSWIKNHVGGYVE